MLVRYQAAPRSDRFSHRRAGVLGAGALPSAVSVYTRQRDCRQSPRCSAQGSNRASSLSRKERQLGDRLGDFPAPLVRFAQLADIDGVALEGFDAFLQRPFAHQALHALDGIALVVKQASDLAQKLHVLRPVVTPAAAPLQGPHLGEFRLPETQHMLRDFKFVGYLADGAKGACGFFELAGPWGRPRLRRLILLRAFGGSRGVHDAAPFTRLFSTWEARNTSTRRGLIGTS